MAVKLRYCKIATIIIFAAILTACSVTSQPTPQANTISVQPTEIMMESTPTVLPTETPTISLPPTKAAPTQPAEITEVPTLLTREVVDESVLYLPPDFSTMPKIDMSVPREFDEKDADVYYGLYRVEVGPVEPGTLTLEQMKAEMEKYSQSLSGVREAWYEHDGYKTAVLVNQASQIWIYFDEQGKLAFPGPGLWDPNSTNATWVKRPNVKTHQIEVLDRFYVLRNNQTKKS